MTYAEKFKDPRWQRKRLEIMQRDEFSCRVCSSKEKTLNVHHSYYVKGRQPWEYPTFSLVTWCEDCHERQHSETFEEAGFTEWEREMDFVLGGKPEETGRFWPVSVEIGMAISDGAYIGDIYEYLVAAMRAFRAGQQV